MFTRDDLKRLDKDTLVNLYLECLKKNQTKPKQFQRPKIDQPQADEIPSWKKLADFAYLSPSRYNKKLKELAEELAQKEVWEFPIRKNNTYEILKNYIYNTFLRLKQENKICYSSDNKHAIFDTGLLTSNLEKIFAYFKETQNENLKQLPFCFSAFIKASDDLLQNFDETPERADYFQNPQHFIFNSKFEIIPNIDHIIEDEENIERLPEHIRKLPQEGIRDKLIAAVEVTKKHLLTNYALALPNYYTFWDNNRKEMRSQINLLVPLHLKSGSPYPSLALALRANYSAQTYTGATCLTLDMAYKNVRCIRKIEGSWLTAALQPIQKEDQAKT